MKPAKYYLKKELEKYLVKNPSAKILELGCGHAVVAADVLKKFPNVEYWGIEPGERSYLAAKENLKEYNRVKLFNDLAYLKKIEGLEEFDIVFSLSVLEHVKDLDNFLKLSVEAAKPGGKIIHLYDLGHALYPSNLKEKIQIFLSNLESTRKFLPESKIACHVNLKNLKEKMLNLGTRIERVSFHNMPTNVLFIKSVNENIEAMEEVVKQELKLSEMVADEKIEIKEKIFPTIGVWTVKKL